MAALPGPALAAPPGPARVGPSGPRRPPISPEQLSKQLRRSQDVVRVRPSRTVPAIFVILVVLAIAAAWLMLFQRP